MKLVYLFLILVLLTIGAMVAMPFVVLGKFIILSEGLLGLIVIVEALLYIWVIRPVKLLNRGMEMIRAKDFSSTLKPVNQYEADNVIKTFNALTDMLRNERIRRQERNQLLSMLIEKSPTGIIILDYEGKIAEINPIAYDILKLTDKSYAGKFLLDIDSRLAYKCSFIPAGRCETIRMSDTEIVKCSVDRFIDRGFERNFIILENLSDDVRQAEREAYHRVIRMLAHEVNNTMCGLTTTIDALDFALGDDAEIHDVLVGCHDRCDSLSDFITSYASVVKIPEPKFETADINKVIMRQIQFLESVVSPVPVIIEYSPQPAMANIDSTLWEQVLVNIVKNSAESIGNTPGGNIVINVDCYPTSVTVTDNGSGISEYAASHLFSPFFSTKASGNGLGLILVGEVLRRHGCTFSLETSPKDGLTRFRIAFPTV
ncbi:MAG: HAMP domain-containing protein [Muribaculum sp.]|nr:HAMP domain-containing protein [Muribaculum sp.]